MDNTFIVVWISCGFFACNGEPILSALKSLTVGNEYVGLYFFSAMFQGNMALIALTGVFAIFRLQLLDQELTSAYSRLRELVRVNMTPLEEPTVFSSIAKLTSADDIIQSLDAWSKMDARTTGEGYLHNLAERVLKREEIQVVSVQSRTLSLLRDDTVDAMHVSFQWILTMIVLSLVLIPAIHYIYTLSGIAEIAVFVITAILQIIALRKCRKFVYHVSVRRPDFKHTELEFNRKK